MQIIIVIRSVATDITISIVIIIILIIILIISIVIIIIVNIIAIATGIIIVTIIFIFIIIIIIKMCIRDSLDLFKSQSTLRASKKSLKHRFWTEVYQGAKLFYLSGVINGRYPDREILNLSRFISVMKFRPLQWRNEHPYLLADRISDLTHPELLQSKGMHIDRKVAIYGYLHGTPLPSTPGYRVHIAGVGDYQIDHVEKLPDPCPTPYYQQKLDEFERERAKEEGSTSATTVRRRKRLDDKQKLIYAPMSDVGGLLPVSYTHLDVYKRQVTRCT